MFQNVYPNYFSACFSYAHEIQQSLPKHLHLQQRLRLQAPFRQQLHRLQRHRLSQDFRLSQFLPQQHLRPTRLRLLPKLRLPMLRQIRLALSNLQAPSLLLRFLWLFCLQSLRRQFRLLSRLKSILSVSKNFRSHLYILLDCLGNTNINLSRLVIQTVSSRSRCCPHL